MPTPRQYQTDADRQRAYRERQKQARLTELAAKNLPAAPPIPSMPGTARWKALQEQARLALQTTLDEMQAYYDERSEAWQEGERAATMQEQIEALTDVLSNLDAATIP